MKEKHTCDGCGIVMAGMDTPPWLWNPTKAVISGSGQNGTWCQKRALHYGLPQQTISSMADKKFIDEIVKAHNEYRGRHQASSLKHAKDLSEFAQKWADHLASLGQLQHSDCKHKGDTLGENIAMKWSSRPDAYSGQEVTDQWYSEVKMHTFGGEPSSLSSGHFTQVVWKGSKEIGVGKAQDRNGKTIVVASYRPAGNMMGQFGTNVLPPKDGKIQLPVSTDKPSGGRSSPFSSRFEGARGPSGGASGGGTETKTTSTRTITEGDVTRTIVEETIIKADGSKVTNKRETTTTAGSKPSGLKDDDFGRLSLKDDHCKTHSKGKRGARSKSSSSSSSSDSSPERSKKPQKLKEFINDAVDGHNDLRKKHGASKLKHAKDLTEYAQKWAEHLAATDSFKHSECTIKGERIGENVCCKWSSAGADYTGREACEHWYSEISKHDFSSEPRTLGSGHFTQVVWKGSKEMGIGKAKTSKGKVIVVANYRPAGNLVGHFVENVGSLKK